MSREACGPVVECVPNISEGRSLAQIERVVEALRRVKRLSVLHIDSDGDTNRTVLTLAGPPEAVEEGCFEMYRACFAYLDMRQHQGVHPRLGAVDVCPIVPLLNTSMTDCIALSHRLGARLASELGVTGYFYEQSALQESRRALPKVRRGQFESLPSRFSDPHWVPDFGKFPCDLKFGVTILGAREILVAFNVTLDTKEQSIADRIAAEIRTTVMNRGADQVVDEHRLSDLRAIGWYLARRGFAQVSCNLLDYRRTSVLQVFEKIAERAEAYGTRVLGSELIGLIPETSLVDAGLWVSGEAVTTPLSADERERLMKSAVRHLGLDLWGAFSLDQRVLDRALRRQLLSGWPTAEPVIR